MPTFEKIHIQGECTTGPGNTFQIPIPQLPATGAWSITGTVLAFNIDAESPGASASLAMFPTITGNGVGGSLGETDNLAPTPYTKLPVTGGLVAAGFTVAISGQTLYLNLSNDTEDVVVAFGWDLDVAVLSLP